MKNVPRRVDGTNLSISYSRLASSQIVCVPHYHTFPVLCWNGTSAAVSSCAVAMLSLLLIVIHADSPTVWCAWQVEVRIRVSVVDTVPPNAWSN